MSRWHDQLWYRHVRRENTDIAALGAVFLNHPQKQSLRDLAHPSGLSKRRAYVLLGRMLEWGWIILDVPEPDRAVGWLRRRVVVGRPLRYTLTDLGYIHLARKPEQISEPDHPDGQQ